ncbi:hypothetical protein AAK894_14450 [Lachnospiraceae bacterium 46-61]
MNITKEYKKNTITVQMLYPCEMYQILTETKQNTEKKKETKQNSYQEKL